MTRLVENLFRRIVAASLAEAPPDNVIDLHLLVDRRKGNHRQKSHGSWSPAMTSNRSITTHYGGVRDDEAAARSDRTRS
jgi:hypothetical protein